MSERAAGFGDEDDDEEEEDREREEEDEQGGAEEVRCCEDGEVENAEGVLVFFLFFSLEADVEGDEEDEVGECQVPEESGGLWLVLGCDDVFFSLEFLVDSEKCLVDSFSVGALLEVGSEFFSADASEFGVVEDCFESVAGFESVLSFVFGDEEEESVVVGFADAPFFEEGGGEVFNRVSLEGGDGGDGDFCGGFLFDLLDELGESCFVFGGEEVRVVVDVALGWWCVGCEGKRKEQEGGEEKGTKEWEYIVFHERGGVRRCFYILLLELANCF